MYIGKRAMTTLIILSLTGCKATDMITGNSNIRGLEQDISDLCDAYRDPLRQLNDEYKSKVFNSMLTGAVLGAFTGAALSSDEDKSKGAILGALGGGIAGGVAGNEMAQANQRRSSQEVEADLSKLAAGERRKVSRVSQSIRNMYDCRASEYATLTERFKSGELSKADAIETKSRIDAKVSTDEQLIDYVLGGAEERFDALLERHQEMILTEPLSELGKYYQVTASGGLNVRKEPISNAQRIGKLQESTIVVGVPLSDNKWIKVHTSNGDGYVSSLYMKEALEQQITEMSAPKGEIREFSKDITMNKDIQKQKEAELKRQQDLAAALILG